MSFRIDILGDSLDLKKDTSLEFVSKRPTLNANGQAGTSAVKSISLPATDKNRSILAEFKESYAINLVVGKETFQNYNLKPSECNDSSKEVKADLKDENNLLECLKNTRLCDLDLITYPWNLQQIQDSWVQGMFLDSGGGEVMPFVADFGQLDGALSPEDLRLAVSRLYILQQFACDCGYTYRDEFLESDLGRTIYDYKHSVTLFDNIEGRLEAWEVCLETPTIVSFQNLFRIEVMPLDVIKQDNSGSLTTYPNQNPLNNHTGYLHPLIDGRPVELCLEWEMSFRIITTNETSTEILFFVGVSGLPITSFGGGGGGDDFTIPNFDPSVFNVSGTFTANVTNDYTISVGLSELNNTTIEILSFNGKISIKDKQFVIGDQIKVNQTLDCEIDGLEYLKDHLHQVNGIYEIDNNTKTITVYPNDDVELWGERYKGYMNKRALAKDLTDCIECDTLIKKRTKDNNVKNIILGFKDSQDNCIDENIRNAEYNQPGETEPFRTVDILDETEDKFQRVLAKLIEPTINVYNSEVGFNGSELWMPKIRNNSDDGVSYDVGCRTFFFQYTRQTKATVLQEWDVSGMTDGITVFDSELFPTFYQDCPPSDLLLENYQGQNLIFTKEKESLYNFYEGSINRFNVGLSLSFIVNADLCKYLLSSFRDYYKINYKGFQYVLMLQEKRTSTDCKKRNRWLFTQD